MSLTSVNVTGTLALPSGQPASNAHVWFTLSNPGLLGITVVLPVTAKTITDDNGNFLVTLEPNAVNTYYTVAVYRETGSVILETVAIIPNTDCKFSQVIQVSNPTTLTASITAIEDLKNAKASLELARIVAVNNITADSKIELVKFKSDLEAYKSSIQNNFLDLIDKSMSSTPDLVLAYQLSN